MVVYYTNTPSHIHVLPTKYTTLDSIRKTINSGMMLISGGVRRPKGPNPAINCVNIERASSGLSAYLYIRVCVDICVYIYIYVYVGMYMNIIIYNILFDSNIVPCMNIHFI